jgi:elongation factor G
VLNSVKGKKERIGRILQMHANQREEIKEVRAGDIAAVGLKDVTTGDTLCDPANPIMLERMVFPEPVISQAVEPKTKADQEKMGIALNRLAQEDPSFRVRPTKNRARPSFPAWASCTSKSRRPHEARIRRGSQRRQAAGCLPRNHPQDGEGRRRQVRQAVGRSRPVRSRGLTLEPNEPGKGFEFVDAIKGGVIPREYIPAVDKGIRTR